MSWSSLISNIPLSSVTNHLQIHRTISLASPHLPLRTKDSHSQQAEQSRPTNRTSVSSTPKRNAIKNSQSYLEPSPSLRCRLQRITISTMGIVTRSRRVGGPITLTTGLDPDKGVFQLVSGVGCRPNTETSAFHVAPVTPSLLLGWLDAVAA